MTTIRILGAMAMAWLAGGLPWAMAAGDTGAPRLSAADKAIYAEAFRLAKDRRFDRARALSRTANDPRLGKVILWLGFSAPGSQNGGSQGGGSQSGDFRAIAAFLEGNPDWPGRGALRFRAEKALPDDLPDAEILTWFETQAALTLDGAVRHAEALMRADRQDRAIEVLRAAWIRRDFARAREAPFLKRFGKFIRKEDQVARLDRLIWSRSYGTARRQARRLGKDYVALTEARLRLAGGRPGVDSAIRRVPDSLRDDPGLLYERARWRQRRGRYADVTALLDPPDSAAPRAVRWWPLRQWAARQALVEGDISVAYRIASRHGMTEGIGFAEAEWLAGWIGLRFLDMPRQAYEHFTRLHDGVSSSVSLGRAAFWAGEAARELAQRAGITENAVELWRRRARQWYANAAAHDTSFYGQLASRRLGRDPMVDLRARGTPSAQDRQAFDDRELIQIVRLLSEIGETRLLERFLAQLRYKAGTGKDYALVAELANSVGRPDLATGAARAARTDGIILPGFLFPTMPLPEMTLPEAVSPEAGWPETALLLALIRQESGFYPKAVSRAGARGLMQIMPATARRVAKRIEVPYDRDKLLDDPDYNLLLGQTYLSGLLERYGGSYILALAAYNAGPGRADRWIETFGDPRASDVDAVEWIESIPFDETRNYVQRVLESLIAYRQQLGTARLGREGLPDLSPFAPTQQRRASGENFSCCI